MRILIAVCLCLTFQGVLQHVLRSNRDTALQAASNQRDGTPDHDWRRAGDGTTRALQSQLSVDRAVAPAFPIDSSEPAIQTRASLSLRAGRAGGVAGPRLAGSDGPPTPLRI